jgi:Mg2+ and Co2+ transporter CorA
VPLADGMAARLKDHQLLWIDFDHRDGEELSRVAAATGMDETLIRRLAEPSTRADLTQYADCIHLALLAVDPGASDDASADPVARPIDIVGGRNWVVTVHDGPFEALRRLDAEREGETRLGALDAGTFLAAIADEVLAGYFAVVEEIEREIDQLDERALRGRPDREVLVRIVGLRRRIGMIRRILAPHRVAFASLARPDMDLHDELGRPWPGLTDRLDRALEAVENLRDLLLGTFDIHMGRAAQDANDVMKALTLVSAVFLPAVVLAGVMGMNFQLPFFEDPGHFWWVVIAMAAFAVTILVVARVRRWF